MAVRECKLDGKPGWKYGEDGDCFTYDPDSASGSTVAKAKALKQAATSKTGTKKNQRMDGQVQI